LLTLLLSLAATVDPTVSATTETPPAASATLTREGREALAESVLHGSPDDPIRGQARLDRDRPAMTEQQAWAQVIDGNTVEHDGGPVIGEAELERQRLAIAAQQDAEARARYAPASFSEMLGAAWNGTISASIGRAISGRIDPRQAAPSFDYIASAGQLENGRSLRERDELRRDALSMEHAREIIARQDRARRDTQALSSPMGRVMALAVRLLDPAAMLLIALLLAVVWAAGGQRVWSRLRRHGDQPALAQ